MMIELIRRLRSVEHADVPQKYLMLEAAEKIEAMLAIVDEQAEDDILWAPAYTAVSLALQAALRRLHEAVEGKTSEQCARAVLD